MHRFLPSFLLAMACTAPLAAQGTGNFGSGQFAIDTGTSNFDQISQITSSVSVSGTDNGETIAGTFSAPLNFTGLSSLSLTGSISGTNPNSEFTVLLYNSDLSQTQTYSGSFFDFGTGTSSVALSLESEDSAFTDIGGFQLITDGVGANVSFTLVSLNASASAIPEPAAFMAWASAAVLGLYAAVRIRTARGVRPAAGRRVVS